MTSGSVTLSQYDHNLLSLMQYECATNESFIPSHLHFISDSFLQYIYMRFQRQYNHLLVYMFVMAELMTDLL